MKRTEFLKTLGLLGAAAWLPLGAVSAGRSGRGKVLVIGAGMSGISAARALQNAGWQVQILEARERIGGRVWTDESLGMPMDMGASWIQESVGNPLTTLARQFGLKTIATNWDSIHVWDSQGKKLSADELAALYAESQKIFRKARKYGNRSGNDISVGAALQEALEGQEMTTAQKARFDWRLATQELDAAIEMEKLSAWGDREDGFAGADLLFPDGYGALVSGLAQGLDILLGEPVTEISHNGSGVKLSTQKGVHEADYAVVTLPLGVLKAGKVAFSPALPASKTTAIQSLGMGNLNKIAMRFPECSWPKDSNFLGYIAEKKGEFPVFVNWAHFVDQPFLLGTVGNEFSIELDRLSNEAIAGKLGRVMEKITGKENAPEALKYSSWRTDVYAAGSYSYLPPGVKGDCYEALASPVGRLHFAGEASIRGYSATVHGAYMSGIRAAKEIDGK